MFIFHHYHYSLYIIVDNIPIYLLRYFNMKVTIPIDDFNVENTCDVYLANIKPEVIVINAGGFLPRKRVPINYIIEWEVNESASNNHVTR